MSNIIIASLQPGEGRTAVAAGLGALLAAQGRSVRLLRERAAGGADPAAEDDAGTLALVPGCKGSRSAVTEQEALAEAKKAAESDAELVLETPAGVSADAATRMDARVVLVTSLTDDARIGDLAAAAQHLGDRLLGVCATRQARRKLDDARERLTARGLSALALLPEDRLLAQPTPNELVETLSASLLAESGGADEAVEYVMLGPISADPGQPYFLRREGKAIVNRFDKMDLHLAALATDPDCLVLTGGQMPSPYFLDRLQGGDADVTVLLSPESTVRTVELLDELFTRTRLTGSKKVNRAVELFAEHADLASIA